jgi:K+-H+ exchange-related protein
MKVFLVPAGAGRYELYCRTRREPPAGPGKRRTLRARAMAAFSRVVAEGEAARQSESAPGAAQHSRLRRFITGRIAEAVAEQRLLWYIRNETAVELVHPDDLSDNRALEIVRAELQHDHDRHTRWTIIDGLLTIVAAPFALIPGPNLLGYYFLFRTVGHYLSVRGAKQGLNRITWTPTASARVERRPPV